MTYAQDQNLDQQVQTQRNSVLERVQRPDDDLLIMSLTLGNVTIFDPLLIYEDLDSGKYYLPLRDFFEGLEFPISVDLAKGTAEGWFLRGDRLFSLDLNSGKAFVSGEEYALSVDDVERHDDGIYVSLELLQKWFPLTLEVEFSSLAIAVKSLEPLPIEVRIERDKKRESVTTARSFKKKQYPLKTIKVPFFTVPFFDNNVQMGYERADSVEEPFSVSATTRAGGILAGQDFLFSANDTSSNEEDVDIRAKLGRKDLNGNLFGIGLSEYNLGDVVTQSLPLISRGTAGRGLSISSKPLSSFDGAQSGSIELRGELAVGYQVDVMRNGQLLGFLEEPDENGEYIFDLNVFPGLNVFELVFYGPQGQKETKEERIYIPINPIQKNSFDFKVDVIQDSTNLFTNRNSSSSDKDLGAYRFSGEAQYGLTGTSSLYGAVADLSVDGERQKYGLLRYSRSFGGVRGDVSYARSGDGGNSASLRLQTQFKGISWQFQHDYYNGFISEQTLRSGLSGDLKHETNLRLSGLLPFAKNTPFSLNIERLYNEDSVDRIEWRGRVTRNINKVRFTSEIKQKIQDNIDRDTDLNLQIGSRFENVNLRGNIRYELEPTRALSGVSLSADWRINPKSSLRAGVRRSGAKNPVHTVNLGASRSFDPIRLGLNFSYDDNDELRALLSSSFSLGYDPGRSSVFMREKRLAETAIFSPRVFYDKNSNSVFDGDDEWMQDIHFAGARVDRDAKTDRYGSVTLAGIEPYRRGTFELNTSSLPDPYMRSVIKPRDYILRPGQVVQQDFPVIIVGEVDGDVMLAKNGERRAAQAIEVQIVEPVSGEIIQTAKTEYDGFIWVQDVPLGSYKARVAPQALQSLGYCAAPIEREMTLTVEEPFASIGKFLLWPHMQKGNIGIVLAHGTDVDGLKAQWNELRLFLQDILYDPSSYPESYLIRRKEDDDAHTVILHNVSPNTASAICEALGETGRACAMYQENICPVSMKPIKQVSVGAFINEPSALNTDLTLENFNGDDLAPVDQQRIIDIIDN